MSGGKSILLDSFSHEAIEKTVNSNQPFYIHCNVVDNFFIYNVEKCILAILKRKSFPNFHTSLTFVAKELIDNANKANLKRVFFKKNNLEINLPEDYEKGVARFTQTLKTGEKSLQHYLIQENYYVQVYFKSYADSEIHIEIINNALPTHEERKRIHEKQKNFFKMKESHEKSLGEIDETEGAGMGLFLSLKVLFRHGISPEAFTIQELQGCTVARLQFSYQTIIDSPICISGE